MARQTPHRLLSWIKFFKGGNKAYLDAYLDYDLNVNVDIRFESSAEIKFRIQAARYNINLQRIEKYARIQQT